MNYSRLLQRTCTWRRSLERRRKTAKSGIGRIFLALQWRLYGTAVGVLCSPFFLHRSEHGYQALCRVGCAEVLPEEEFRTHRRRGAILATTLLMLTGVSELSALRTPEPWSPPHLTFDTAFDNHDWEVFVDGPHGSDHTNNDTDDRFVDVAGWLAVWQRLTENGWQVVLFDGAKNKETELTDELGDHINPRTDGRYVVWQGQDGPIWRIYAFDTETPEDGVRLLSGDGNAMSPRISSGTVVWQEWVLGNWEVMADRFGNNPVRLTTNLTEDIAPDVFDSWVTWQAVDADHHSRILLVDLDSGTETAADGGAGEGHAPRFEQGELVWVNEDHGVGLEKRIDMLTKKTRQDELFRLPDAMDEATSPTSDASSTEPLPLVEPLELVPTSTTEENPSSSVVEPAPIVEPAPVETPSSEETVPAPDAPAPPSDASPDPVTPTP